ncbi:LNS2 domain-containing protein [Algicola sagamiensis]|uniref:LNS2 domain-containing protein n=1 Tax=Algicola sagamiensis TaxID=163869 RepID=UPI0003A8EE20|nr:hypothetical protein [Algicola sagamiensis]
MRTLLYCLLLGMIPVASQATTCPDYTVYQSAPSFEHPEQESFQHFWNEWLSWDQSFHMLHDVVVGEYESTTMTAKFDYGGVFHKDLEDEYIQAYIYGTNMPHWQPLGRYKTNSDGIAEVELPGLPAGQYRVKTVVMGDLTQAEGYITVLDSTRKAVVFDIDATLTKSNAEQIKDYLELELAEPRPGAYRLVKEYMERDYQVIFLTARVYWYSSGTRNWLSMMGLPEGILRLSRNNGDSLFRPAQYKAEFLQDIQSKGVEIYRAYGNATTDVEAYAQAGIPKEETYIIGEYAGYEDTVAIEESGYLQHIQDVVLSTPVAICE